MKIILKNATQKLLSIAGKLIKLVVKIFQNSYMIASDTFWVWGTLVLNVYLMRVLNQDDFKNCITWYNGVVEIIDLSEEEFGDTIIFLIMLIVVVVNLIICINKFLFVKGNLAAIFRSLIVIYLMVVVNFAMLYYSICHHNDFRFSAINYNEYALFYKINLTYDRGTDENCELKIDSVNQISFNQNKSKWTPTIEGISKSLWFSLDNPSDEMKRYFLQKHPYEDKEYYFDLNFKKELTEKEKIELIENRHSPCNSNLETLSLFGSVNSNEESSVFYDCFIFSAKALSNLEVGNYSPSTSITKFLTAIEAIVGVILFVFALGLVFTNNTNNTTDT